MALTPMKTSALAKGGPTKCLLYAHHGWGKTYQCRHYQEAYGPGLIISGESGLKSVEDVDIDYVPFASWDGPEKDGVYSFRGIVKLIRQDELTKKYKWLAIDSLTELGERLIEHLEEEHKESKNGFAMWGDYSRLMTGSLKWIRDLPVHVYVTALAKEEKDANDVTQYWPMLPGAAVGKKVPALFDHVMCGVRTTETDDSGRPRVKRYVVTDEVSGWHGKTRDPRGRIEAYEACDNITSLFDRMSMTDEEFSTMKKKG